MASFNSAVVARVAAALYDVQLGNAGMTWALNAVDSVTYGGSVAALVQDVYNRDFKSSTYAQVAAVIVKNVGITTGAADAAAYVAGQLTAAGAGKEGATIVALMNAFAGLTNHPVAAYNTAATAFNAQISAALAYAQSSDTPDVQIHLPPAGPTVAQIFNLTATTALGADVMRLTGGQDVRIDFTNPANQIRGLDLDGDGLIETNGIENVSSNFDPADRGANFEIVDAYSRNPLNHTDSANNFLGDIAFDGTAFDGDGVSTDGNVFLGGLGVDTAFGGVGNDFLAGGGIAQGRSGFDTLRGGRNADFFFAEFSGIDRTDGGQSLFVDGGNTADDTAAGEHSAQDSDWLLFEASDDDEPVMIQLEELGGVAVNDDQDVQSRSGEWMDLDDVENFDASGNLYGFLDNMDVEIGGRGIDTRDASTASVGYNYGLGSSAQLRVLGSEVGNIIIAGYDNDYVEGRGGDDLLMGGNLNFNNNPNLKGIWNNGQDELIAGDGDDHVVFETDGGIYEGGRQFNNDKDVNSSNTDIDTAGGHDTLWLTREAFGTKTAADVTTDSTVRIDLLVGKQGGLENAAGYGGADKAARTGNYTSDQSNYKAGFARAQVQDFDSVVATGLGAVDYLAAGTNNPELHFANQQNHFGFVGNLDLRGTYGDNVLYATAGTDVLEGRGGNDALSGGDGNDDFYFAIDGDMGGEDGVDVIHRQTDDGHNLWATDADGNELYERDFNIGGTSSKGASSLTVDLGSTNLASADVAMTSFSIKIGGATFAVVDAAALMAANSAAEVAALVNAAYNAKDAKVSAKASGNTIVVTDLEGRDISDTVSEGYAVGGVVSNGAFSAQATFNPAGTTTTKDRLIYKAYEDRADNEGVDDDSVLGSTISLGYDGYAEDLVINFADEDGDGLATTRIAEDQEYRIDFTNLTTQDKVVITVNGVKYSLQVGVDLDGNIIDNEDTIHTSQTVIQNNFVNRLAGFINSFMDDDTSVGAIDASSSGSSLYLWQRSYHGEETVFMTAPVVTLSNLSGGEPAKAAVTNISAHELELLDFDGRNAQLNETNVLFVGQEFVSRSELSTAATAGGTQTGNEAIVIDTNVDDLQGTVFGSTAVIANNTTTNDDLAGIVSGFAVHGDDFLLGGAGLDTINGGTGDDRVEGSVGGNGSTTWDVLDGGKNFYAVQVLGEPQQRVYVLNKWEAAAGNWNKTGNPLAGLTISSVNIIEQNEGGHGTDSGIFDDTLQFSQKNFTSGATRFTVVLDDYVVTGGVVELKNDGAGKVGVDVDGNGTIDNWTKFTNFENIRTVSGTGNAVAGDGQGNDTLDVTLLSSTTTGAGGISYDLTNNGTAGEVRYSVDAILTTPVGTDFPVLGDYESLVLKVDGVENVLASTGADLLTIDETEAAKDNRFSAGLGVDRIDYQNDYGVTTGVPEPTVTIKVDNVAAALGGTDTVKMTGGRVGTTVATDTLEGVEYISLNGHTGESSRENDLLDVTSMTAGAVVSYVDGTVKDLSGTTHVTIHNLYEVENVWADGNDTVIVADAATMAGNAREDLTNGTPNRDIQLATFLDFDEFNGTTGARIPFASQTPAQIANAINQMEYTFSLSKTGTGADSDTVDYSNETGRIVAVMNFTPNDPNKYVLVDGNTSAIASAANRDVALTDAESRIDKLVSVERIVASQGDSIIDATNAGRDVNISFSYNQPNQKVDFVEGIHKVAAADRQINVVRVADAASQTALGNVDLVEYRDLGDSTTVTQATAAWESVQGSDYREYVEFTQWEDQITHTLTLRGGKNEVNYNERTNGIRLTINSLNTTVDGVANQYQLSVHHLNDEGNTVGGYDDFISGYNQSNKVGGGSGANAGLTANSLRIEASQGDQDFIDYIGSNLAAVVLLGQVESSGSSVVTASFVDITTGAASGAGLTLSGFEKFWDGVGNDVYNITDLTGFAQKVTLVDYNQLGAGPNPPSSDRDTIKLGNGAFETALIRPPVAHTLTINNTLHMGDLDANDLQWLGVNDVNAMEPLGTGGSEGFDFQVLDISDVTNQVNITAAGSAAGTNDELIVGGLNYLSTTGTAITNFDTLSLTTASAGTSFDFDLDADQLQDGTNAKIVGFDADMGVLDLSRVLDGRSTTIRVTDGAAVGAAVTGGNGADTITGGAGADSLRGGLGADVLEGGTAAEVREIQINPTGSAGADGTAVTITLDGLVLTVNLDATIDDTDANLGNDIDLTPAVGSVALGNALRDLVNANLTDINDGVRFGGTVLQGVTFDGSILRFTFAGGSDVAVTDTIAVAGAGLGAITVTAENATAQGGSGGIDTFVFEKDGATNGADTINNFAAYDDANDDLLDFRAFTGSSYSVTTATDWTSGVNLTGAGNDVAVVYNFNKVGGVLAASDVQLTAAASKIALGDNQKAVIVITTDANGVSDNVSKEAYKVYFVEDTNTSASAQTWSVTLVATLNSVIELDAIDFTATLDGFAG